MIATRSPGWIPAAARPLATAVTSARKAAAVTSSHVPPALRPSSAVWGVSAAAEWTMSVRLPVGPTSYKGGTLYSRTVLVTPRLRGRTAGSCP